MQQPVREAKTNSETYGLEETSRESTSYEGPVSSSGMSSDTEGIVVDLIQTPRAQRRPTLLQVQSPLTYSPAILGPSPPGTPNHTSDTPLLYAQTPRQVLSPLNPHALHSIPVAGPSGLRSRSSASHLFTFGQLNMSHVGPSDESQAFASGGKGSMLLYRLASDTDLQFTPPPTHLSPGQHREYNPRAHPPIRRASTGAESLFSLDSKYPASPHSLNRSRGLIPYVYDPSLDDNDDPQDDLLHKLTPGIDDRGTTHTIFTLRGLTNLGVLLFALLGLLTLFIFYPIYDYHAHASRRLAINTNIHINATGQAPFPVLLSHSSIIDRDTPSQAMSRTGFDGESYVLVFSDEFNTPGRTFYPGDDPYWEAVDLWYGATQDLEWYDPGQVTTRDGSLVILLEEVENHGLNFRSGMLQSWNKFCFTGGYIEVAVSLPGDADSSGYWPGIWTLGNLARPGYGGTTDGTWPYTYNSCDVGTFPNQTYANGTGPAAALHTDEGREVYDYELSWLTGQKFSACTCPSSASSHPGPNTSKGRGAPEIDILEAQKNKLGPGAKASQSLQVAPFAHDYVYDNSTQDNWMVYDADVTQPNGYHGSAVQQALSGLTDLPPDLFNASGDGVFYTFGFEYWTDPSNPQDGFVTWQFNGSPTIHVGAEAVGPDLGPDGSGVGQRLIPEEPMSIVFNLAISDSFQQVDLSTLTFPAELHIDYVRVYQRESQQNIGCNPKEYPTTDYIEQFWNVYSNPNITMWGNGPSGANLTKPLNSLYDGC